MQTTLTYRYRIKDQNCREQLQRMARDVNYLWNYCNDIKNRRWQESRRQTNESDLSRLTKGSSKLLGINAQSIQAVYQELLTRGRGKRIRFRSRRTKLGWIPFKGQTFKFNGNYSTYNGHKIRYWYHRPLPEGAEVRCGCFAQDSLGRWFLNLVVQFPEYLGQAPDQDLGIDLGIKTVATTSAGERLTRPNFSTQNEPALAKAQRRRKKRKARRIQLLTKNQRLDWNHKAAHRLANNYRTIFVGDARSSDILTNINNINKSVYDASWYCLKTFLSYKVLRRRGVFRETSELDSTVTCNRCLAKTGPSGVKSLRIRGWTCSGCQAVHDRDVNAALNILRLGRETLRASLEGSPGL